MIAPGIYRVNGKYTSRYVGVVEVLEATDDHVNCRRSDGKVVTLSRNTVEALRWTRIDQSSAYGNDCPGGRCEV